MLDTAVCRNAFKSLYCYFNTIYTWARSQLSNNCYSICSITVRSVYGLMKTHLKRCQYEKKTIKIVCAWPEIFGVFLSLSHLCSRADQCNYENLCTNPNEQEKRSSGITIQHLPMQKTENTLHNNRRPEAFFAKPLYRTKIYYRLQWNNKLLEKKYVMMCYADNRDIVAAVCE